MKFNFRAWVLVSFLGMASLFKQPAFAYDLVPLPDVRVMKSLNNSALSGLRANWTTKQRYYCSKWVRQVVEHALPQQAIELRNRLFGYSANDTARKWRNYGLVSSLAHIMARGGLRAGDVVFQEFGSGGYGHVGIVVQHSGRLMIAENSLRSRNPYDARVLTPIANFGRITGVGRL